MLKTFIMAVTLVLTLSLFGWISNKLFGKRRARKAAIDAENSRIWKEERRSNVAKKIAAFDNYFEKYFQDKNIENKTNVENSWEELNKLHLSIFTEKDQKDEITKRKNLYERI